MDLLEFIAYLSEKGLTDILTPILIFFSWLLLILFYKFVYKRNETLKEQEIKIIKNEIHEVKTDFKTVFSILDILKILFFKENPNLIKEWDKLNELKGLK